MVNYHDCHLIFPNEMNPLKEPPPFPWKGHNEEDFRCFVEHCQPLFDNFGDFLRGDNERRIGPNGLILQPKQVELIELPDPFYIWLDPAQRVTVSLNSDGMFSVVNGRHRFYVARKYGYKIPVFVSRELI